MVVFLAVKALEQGCPQGLKQIHDRWGRCAELDPQVNHSSLLCVGRGQSDTWAFCLSQQM